MRELSLFTGMGGGIYGSLILGWETVAYVEKDEYCRKVIRQRIKDGWFDKGDVYNSIEEFNKNDAKKYAGTIDVLTGGFPCQPFSVAVKRKGTSDDRYLFNEIIKTIKIIQPQRLLFENVPGILASNAIIEIYKSLNKIGYRTKAPLVLGSADCGNIHKRERVWILADSKEFRSRRWTSEECDNGRFERQQTKQERCALRGQTSGCTIRQSNATNSTSSRCNNWQNNRQERQVCETKIRHISQNKSEWNKRKPRANANANVYNTHCSKHRKQRSRTETLHRKQRLSRRESIRSLEDIIQRPDIPEPLFRRVDDELPDWSKQLKAIGNGQDPIVMATAWTLLTA